MNLGLTSPAPWRALFWIAALGVLVLSLLPTVSQLPTTGWDKSNHLLGFATLAVLVRLAYPAQAPIMQMGSILAYGALIEVLQAMTPYRFAEWGDLLADGLGIVLGWSLISIGTKMMSNRRASGTTRR